MEKHTTLYYGQKIFDVWSNIKLLFFINLIGFNIFYAQAQNNPPISQALTDCTGPLTPITVCHNWIDPDGDKVHIEEDDTHTTFNCSLTFLTDTCFRYLPLPGFLGTDTVVITVCDDQEPAACSTSRLTIYVGCLDPIAQDDAVQIAHNSVLINGRSSIDEIGADGILLPILANDEDRCRNLSLLSLLTLPNHGATSIVNNSDVFYTPNANFNGNDQFQYLVCNDCTPPACDTATVNIAILPQDMACNLDFTECIGPFSSKDLCPSFCQVSLEDMDTCLAIAPHGDIGLQIGNCVRYVPDPLFIGTDTVQFIACAGTFCDTTLAFVTIDPACGDHPPTATIDLAQTRVNTGVIVEVLDNDFDIDGQVLTVTNVSEPMHGMASINSDMIVYTPNTGFVGIDTFTYVLCDPTDNCVLGLVVVEVIDQDCADQEYEFCTPSFLFPVKICVEFCDLVGFDGVRVIDATTTFNCSINLLNDSCFRYTPLPGFEGTDTVTIFGRAQNGQRDTLSAQVNLGCAFPEAQNDVVTINTADQSSIQVVILANDMDPCGLPLTPIVLTSPINGVLTTNEDGSILYTPNEGFMGQEEVLYVACNDCEQIRCDTARIQITVTGDGGEPIPFVDAQPDSVETTLETPIKIDFLQNDFGTITTITLEQANHGLVLLENDSLFTYTPDEAFIGIDFFTYRICNSLNQCDEALITINVKAEELVLNLPPIATNDSVSITRNTGLLFNVLLNDRDPNEADTLRVHVLSEPTNGSLSLSAEGTVSYTPNTDFSGTDQFNYVVCDQGNPALCDTGTVVLMIHEMEPIATPLTIQPDVVQTPFETPIAIFVLNNDIGDSLFINGLTMPQNGVVTLNADSKEVVYVPNAGFSGVDDFFYEVCDKRNECTNMIVSVTVLPQDAINQPPHGNHDVAETTINESIIIAVLTNDSDPEQSELTITETTLPINGTVVINETGTLTYTPDADFVGIDSFRYTVCDLENLCVTVSVAVAVGAETIGNTPPLAVMDIDSTTQNTTIEFNVLLNDADPDDHQQLIAELLAATTNGTLSLNNNGLAIYTPAINFEGIDHFTYRVCDNGTPSLCDTAYATIFVFSGETITLIEAAPDVYETPFETSLTINILDNDFGETLNLSENSITDPVHGSVLPNPDGTVTYTPDADYTGSDYFFYQICTDEGLCDFTIVSVFVLEETATPKAPRANNDIAQTTANTTVTIPVLINDRDPENDTLLLTITTPSNHGTLVINEDGTINYTPHPDFEGIDTFTYTICDAQNLCDEAIVGIAVGVDVVQNQPPKAVNDNGIVFVGESLALDVKANDEDPDGDKINGLLIAAPLNGFVILNGETGLATYTPDFGFIGTDYFIYLICDDGHPSLCDTAFVSLLVLEGIRPDAEPDIGYTPENTPIALQPLRNDNGENITITKIGSPHNGTVVEGINGALVYTPEAGFTGTDHFRYTICDQRNLCDQTVVSIIVSATNTPNRSPIAHNDVDTTSIGAAINIPILINDKDPDQEVLLVASTTTPTNGTIALLNDGESIIYQPQPAFLGIDSFTYIVCDPSSFCDTAWVYISVGTGVLSNDPPIAQDDVLETEAETPVVLNLLGNDQDMNQDSLRLSFIGHPSNGTITEIAGEITYIPNNGFSGTDYALYVLCDNGLPSLCDTAVIQVMVAAAIEKEKVVLQVETPEDTDVTICLIEELQLIGAGEIILDIDTVIIYEISDNGIPYYPENNDTCIAYSPITDFSGVDTIIIGVCSTPTICDTVLIIIQVAPEPDVPVAIVDIDTTTVNAPIFIDILANDSDPDGEVLQINNVDTPLNGTAIIVDTMILYTPNEGFVGMDTFSYYIVDTLGLMAAATIIVFVIEGENPPIRPPLPIPVLAIDDIDSTILNTPIVLSILANDSLPTNNIGITIITPPKNGVVEFDSEEAIPTISYVPELNFTGIDLFSYEVCVTLQPDSILCDTAIVTMIVANAPIIADCDGTPIQVSPLMSPNGDGINERLQVFGEDCFEDDQLIVFNRWGDEVYRVENYTNRDGWDGRYQKSNTAVPDGTYFYVYWFKNQEGEVQAVRGFIEVFR